MKKSSAKALFIWLASVLLVFTGATSFVMAKEDKVKVYVEGKRIAYLFEQAGSGKITVPAEFAIAKR